MESLTTGSSSQKKRTGDHLNLTNFSSKESKHDNHDSLKMLDCSICTELFQLDQLDLNPRLLACGHTFCLGCLEKIYKPTTHSVICPNCRRDQKYKKLEDIDVDLQLIRMINLNTMDNQVSLMKD